MLFVVGFESPDFFPTLIKITPPSKPYKEPSCDIFDNPEIYSTEDSHKNECCHETEEEPKEKVAELKEKYTIKAATLKTKVKIQHKGCPASDKL